MTVRAPEVPLVAPYDPICRMSLFSDMQGPASEHGTVLGSWNAHLKASNHAHLGTTVARLWLVDFGKTKMNTGDASRARAGADIAGGVIAELPGLEVLAAAALAGSSVRSSDGEDIGRIFDVMLDVRGGRIAYAILSEGGFLGVGTKLHAIPWGALTLDTTEKCFYVDLAAHKIKEDPGFDKDHWPSMADLQWATTIHGYYNHEPYWQCRVCSGLGD